MIGLLTFYWADDYGALLQAYALKHYLEKMSKKQVEIIPYSPVKLSGRYWFFPIISSFTDGKINYWFSRSRFHTNMRCFSAFLKRKINMRKFRHKYLCRKLPVRKSNRLSVKKYSLAFIGSDQVWNPEITVGLDDVYIGNIPKKGDCRLIAYAASLGSDKLPEENRTAFENALKHNFFAISLREKNAVSFVQDIVHKHIIDTLDPTLLLEKQDWIGISKKTAEQNYILYIYTERNEQMIQSLYNLSQKTGKKIIQLTPLSPENKAVPIEIHADGGPSEYIGYFQNADYVFTNSFHGLVFSIIFEKQFWAFSHSSRNTRLENLLKKLNLESRLIKPDKTPHIAEIDKQIDWKSAKNNLEKEKELSFNFINDILQTCL